MLPIIRNCFRPSIIQKKEVGQIPKTYVTRIKWSMPKWRDVISGKQMTRKYYVKFK